MDIPYTPIPIPELPVIGWLAWKMKITPVIPKFYWDAYSQEEIIKELCKELDSLARYSAYLGDNMNIDRETIDLVATTLNELQAGGWFDTYSELIQQWIRDIDNLEQIVQDVLDENELPSKVTALEDAIDGEGGINDRLDAAESDIDGLQADIHDVGGIDARLTTAEGDIDALELAVGDIGDDLEELERDIESNVVRKIETADDFASLAATVGDLYRTEGFHTPNDGGSALYLITDIGTPNGMSILQTASVGTVAVLVPEGAVHPQQLGATADSDASTVLNYLFSGTLAGVPVETVGSYSIESPLELVASRIPEISFDGTAITASESMAHMLDVVEPYVWQPTISGLMLDGAELATVGLKIHARGICLSGITVKNAVSEQIHTYRDNSESGHVHYTNVSVLGTQAATCKGIVLETNDMILDDITVFYCNIGIELAQSAANMISNVHIWPGNGNAASQYGSIGILVSQTGNNQMNNIYVDGVNTGIRFADSVGGFCKIRGGYALWPELGSGTVPYRYDNPCIIRIGASATVNVTVSDFYNGSTSSDYVYIRTETETSYSDLNGWIPENNARLLTGSKYGQINVAESRMYGNRIARIINNSASISNGSYYPIGYIIAPGNMPATADNSVNMRLTVTSNRVGTFGWADFYVHILRTSGNVYTVDVSKDVRETYAGFEFCIGKIERVKCGTDAGDYNYWAYPVYLHALASRTIGDLWLNFEAAGQKFNWFPVGNAVTVNDSDIIATLNMATV